MQVDIIPKGDFKPIDVSSCDHEGLEPVIRTPSPVKKMILSHEGGNSICSETKYFDVGMKRPREEKMLHDGKIHGKYRRWHDNGFLCEESDYNNGVLNGKQIYYSIYGTVTHEFNFMEGEMHGIQIAYHSNGRIMSRITFKNGRPYGEKSTYYKCGTLKTLETFNDKGLLSGTARIWHPNGRLARDATYINDKLHGMYFEYNDRDLPTLALYFEHGVLKAAVP